MKTVAEILRWRARLAPEREALWHAGRSITYAELDRRASQVANALLAAGVQPGDRVCVLDKGHDEFIEVMFGIAKAGGVYTPVNWRLAPPEIAYVVNDAEAKVLFVGEAFHPAVAAIESELAKVRVIVRWGEGSNTWSTYADFVGEASASDPRCDTAEDETAWQLYTSGTTGHPKGAELTHANLVEVTNVIAMGIGGVRPGDSGLVCMPLYHIGGSGWALALFAAGARLVVTREADPTEILRLIPEEQVHHTFFVPALMNFLLQHPDCAQADFSSLETILYGASPIPEELLVRSLETFQCRLVQAYGLTETTGAVVLLPHEDHVPGSPRLRSCGLPVFGSEIRILAGDGRPCPPGTVGEICMSGPTIMKGYWNRPEATAESIRDGWFHSGDAGYLDDEGYLYIHDRVKDMIVSGGENVYPAEVESVLFSHPDVADVAVIGVPDERWGEAVKAVVVLAPGASVDAQQLVDYCQGKIAGYKRPRSIDFIDALPRNPTGKILKRELREPYWEGKDRQVS
ncbi:MAG: fatty acid--CoA ligase [Proteobacteria bacterium]|nr:fatty acid--CoA ligase [Pseudomonadota bacterium]